MTTNKTFLLAIPVLNFVFGFYVNLRQFFKLSGKITPSASKLCTEERFSLSCKYNKEKIVFGLFRDTFETIYSIVFFLQIQCIYSQFEKKITKRDEIFMLCYMVFSQFVNLPFSLFSDFVIEEKYGFNKKTYGLFVKDFFIGIFLSLVLSGPLLFAMKYIINTFPNFPLYLTIFMALFRVFIIVIYPNFITPLFNKVSPLENLVLKEKVEKMAKKVGFTIDRIEVIDGSKRSGHSNAYFIGIGKAKRIVFYDTILNQMTDDEILAVFCHELGHWYHSHILLNSIVSSATIFMYSFILKFHLKDKKIFKYDASTIIFSMVFSIFSIPLSLLMNSISRTFERQADRFAVEHGFGEHLISGLVKLSTENMGAPVVDSLYSTLLNSHPHVTERIETIEQEMKKKD